MYRFILFALFSVPLIWFSWKPLHDRRAHGFYRYFAFEAILAVVLLNAPQWFVHPFSVMQIISWLCLLASIFMAVHGFWLLRQVGRPQGSFENTTVLVERGAYHYIRHPLYSSLFWLVWGACLKSISLPAVLLADEKKNTDAWRKRFEDSAIQNALVDAAHRSDAFSADQITRLLGPSTRVVERTDERGKGTGDYEVVVDLPDSDEQGNPTTRTLSAREALETMQAKPIYGNLFKSNLVSGVASSSGAGVTPGGRIDVRNLTQEQYMELRRTNPTALGLRPDKRSHL